MAQTAVCSQHLKVPSVHELSKTNPAVIPPRYVRPDEEPPVTLNPASSKEIPVIDMQQMLTDGSLMNSELQKFDSACKEWGFFQLTNHGVDIELLEKLKLQIQEFFDLPLEEKNKYEQQPGTLEGYGLSVGSEKQKLEWADTFSLVTLPTSLRKPHLLPKLPTEFRETLDAYSAECKNLAMKIMSQIAKALGMKYEDMTTLFEEGLQSMRMNYYPPCPQPEQAIGLRAHTDCIAVTLIYQVGDVDGLEIRKDGEWVRVVPLPNAFIINIGDILEVLTNGTYKSVKHRATLNKDEARMSIATFLSPKANAEIAPAPSLITPENPAKFKTIGAVDHFSGCFARGSQHLDDLRI